MSLNYLKTWSINQKIVASVTLLIFSILLFGAIASFFIQGDISVIQSSSIGEQVKELAQKKMNNEVSEVGLFKKIQQLILEGFHYQLFFFPLVLNFYILKGYNLLKI